MSMFRCIVNYVFYNHASPAMIRVVRFTEVSGIGTNPTIIFQVTDPNTAGNHTGGNIHFRPSEPDKLYISIDFNSFINYFI